MEVNNSSFGISLNTGSPNAYLFIILFYIEYGSFMVKCILKLGFKIVNDLIIKTQNQWS